MLGALDEVLDLADKAEGGLEDMAGRQKEGL